MRRSPSWRRRGRLDRGYLGRILTLTLLARDIDEAIMNGRQQAELGINCCGRGFPWSGGAATSLIDSG